MPKHFLKSGVIVAENLISIKGNLLGVSQFCPVIYVVVSNCDVFLSDNTMLGALIQHDNNEVESEAFLCNVVDSIKSKQYLDLIASGCSISLSNKVVELVK